MTPKILRGRETASITENDVVIALLWHMGDVLNVTALLSGLSARHAVPLTFVTSESCVSLLERNPFLKNIVALDVELPTRVRPDDFNRVDVLIKGTLPYVRTLYNLHIPLQLRAVHGHIVESWAKAIGIETALTEPFYVPETVAAPRPEPDEYMVLGNGGTSRNKRWGAADWAAFVELMKNRFPQLRLRQLGSSRDPPIDAVEDRRGQTSITESYRLLKQAQGCLTNDSFLGHLSAAAGCPTYVIYGPQPSRQFHPRGAARIVTFDGRWPCSPCYRDRCLWSFGLTGCFAQVSATAVFAMVAEDLSKAGGLRPR
ncbi:MAG: hypothetical protein OJF47_000282 [Nitrospira sp.]|nr:MAG: hypothetical protein OJF47_000282 [Nitrospira sp.]